MLALLKLVPWWAWVFTALIGFSGVQTWRVHHQQSEVTAFKQAAQTYEQANQTNLATIATLEKANAQWAETMRARLALAKSYSDANIQYQNELQAKLTATRKQLGAIYASHPEAKRWAAEPVPAPLVDQLRASAGH